VLKHILDDMICVLENKEKLTLFALPGFQEVPPAQDS